MGNKLSTNQFWLLASTLSFTYKLNSLAGIIYNGYNSSTAVIFSLYLLVEFLITFCVFRLAKNDIWHKLKQKNRVILSIVLSAFLLIKAFVYLQEQARFASDYLVRDMPFWLIFFILTTTIIIFSSYGMNSLARTNEITIILVALMLLINLFFLRVDMDFSYNTPIFDGNNQGFRGSFQYFSWFGDCLPLIVCGVADNPDNNPKKKIIGYGSYFLGFVFTVMIVVFGVSIYGGAFGKVNSLYVKIGIFNDYSLEFGRLDWIGIMCWMVCSFVVTSSITTALKSSVGLIKNNNNKLYLIALIPLYFVLIYAVSDYEAIKESAANILGYISLFCMLFIFGYMLFYKIRGQNDKKRNKK